MLVQGDTTTVLTTSLACYYRRIPVGHVEAGLRTDDLYSPFPEEGNRRLTSVLARHHFAPTRRSADNLLAEGVAEDRVHLTGNTVVDALLDIDARRPEPAVPVDPDRPLVLITLHRRESFGAAMEGALTAIREVLLARPQVQAVWPVHPNPEVIRVAEAAFEGVENIQLIPPVDYLGFVGLMRRATLLMTDSGGVQEEAPSLGVPLLVLRENTERPEGVEAGVARLCGTDPERVKVEALRLLDDPSAREAMRTADNPYGDGRASDRIAEILERAHAPARS